MPMQYSIGLVISEVSHHCWFYIQSRGVGLDLSQNTGFSYVSLALLLLVRLLFGFASEFCLILVKLDHRLWDSNWLTGWQVLMWNCALIFECVVGHCVYFLQKFLETLFTSRLYILIYKTLYIQTGPFYSVFASHYRPWMFTSWQHCNIRLKMGHKNRDNLKIQNYNKKRAKQCFENTLSKV